MMKGKTSLGCLLSGYKEPIFADYKCNCNLATLCEQCGERTEHLHDEMYRCVSTSTARWLDYRFDTKFRISVALRFNKPNSPSKIH